MNRSIALCAIAMFAALAGSPTFAATEPTSVELGAVRQRLAGFAVPFVPNAGQWDKQAAFAAQTFAGTLFVTGDGKLVYSLPGRRASADTGDGTTGSPPVRPGDRNRDVARGPGWVLTETFLGADRQPIRATPSGDTPFAATVSYLIGNDDTRYGRNLATFERLDLGDVFPGVHVQLRATGNNVEKIFTVAPHRDPAQIRLQVSGASKLELGPQGELIAHTGNGPLTYTAPIAFQDDGAGRREPVGVRYMLRDDTAEYGFALAAYDTTRALVIDPLLQSTYLGASNYDQVRAMAIHPLNGDIYVAGDTTSAASTTFPGVGGGAQTGNGGAAGTTDAFVSRFSANLQSLVQSTYLGAAGNDNALAIAIHPVTGDIYVAGSTTSTGSTFPGVSGSAQGSNGGAAGTMDAFVTRLNSTLSAPIHSTYLGAAGDDQALAMAIHPVTGEVYVAGSTTSTGATFPGVGGSSQGSNGGAAGTMDAFVSRLSADLTGPVHSTYLGGSSDDQANGLAIHPASGDIYVVGHTSSTAFPGVASSAQATYGGGTQDGFVTRLTVDFTSPAKSSYVGGGLYDDLMAVAIHPVNGDVYVAGTTNSYGVTMDALVSRLNPDLSAFVHSALFAGSGSDQALALAIHPVNGDAYAAGGTSSSTGFPGMTGGAQTIYAAGNLDGWVARLSADLASYGQSSYLGAAGFDLVNSIAIHPVSGEIYVGGYTTSTLSSFPGVANGAQPAAGGGGLNDGFVSRYSGDLMAIDVYPAPFGFTAQLGVPTNVVRTSAPVQITGLGSPATVNVNGTLGSAFCIAATSSCACASWVPAGTPGILADGQYICARHVSAPVPNDTRTTAVTVGGRAAKFQTFTGANFTVCTLDVDGNGTADALTDGLLILRALFGLTGTAVTSGATGGNAARQDWASIRAYLNGNCGASFPP